MYNNELGLVVVIVIVVVIVVVVDEDDVAVVVISSLQPCSDIFALPQYMEPAVVLQRFDTIWAEELHKKGKEKASIALCLARCVVHL